jgi:hypothetical protein
MEPAPRPGLGIAAFALGLSSFGLALTSAILGLTVTAAGETPDWLRILLGVALMDAVVGLELGRRAGKLVPPHAVLRKLGAAFALAAILLVLAAAAWMTQR